MKAGKKISILLGSSLWMVALLLAMELLGRFLFFAGEAFSDQYSGDWELRKVTEAFHESLWADLWVTYQPGAEVSYSDHTRDYRTSINSMGFRGPAFPSPEDGDIFKIACIGGSTTVNGPSDLETYPALLEQFLNQKESSRRVKVLNAGVAGMDSGSYHRTVNRLVQEQALPDLVIEYNVINNICWHLIPYWKSQLHPFQRFLLRSFFIKYFAGRFFLPNEASMKADIRRFCIQDLVRLQEQLSQHGTRLAVATFVCPNPSLANAEERRYLETNTRYWWRADYISYASLFRIIGIYNKELYRTFSGTPVSVLPLAESGDFAPDAFHDICHMKPEAIEQKAYLLSHYIAALVK